MAALEARSRIWFFKETPRPRRFEEVRTAGPSAIDVPDENSRGRDFRGGIGSTEWGNMNEGPDVVTSGPSFRCEYNRLAVLEQNLEPILR